MEKKQVPCNVRQNADLSSASWCSALPGLWAVSSCWFIAGLRFRQQSHLGFFFLLQVSHWDTQSSIPFRDTSNCCQVYRCCPIWLAILGKGVRTGFGSSIAGYEHTHQEYATSILQNNTLSPASPCALPCLKPSISYLIVALPGIFVMEQPLSCWRFPGMLKTASIKEL